MGIPNPTHQAASNQIAGLGNYISLHTAAAGTTGANEASGGGYARVQSTPWVQDGLGDNTGPQVTISCAAGTYVEGGIFSVQVGTSLSPPASPSAVLASGGTLTVSQAYFYKVVATNWSGSTTASAEVSATPTSGNQSITVSWTAVTGASGYLGGYQIFRGTTSNGENLLVGTVTGASFTDTGFAGTSSTVPASNTASTFVGSSAFTGGSVTVSGSGATINVLPSVTC